MLKVMIVEDELLARTGLRMLVEWEKNGFQLVAEATDGQEALQILMRTPVDIVITDIRMPVMDGLELMREIRARNLYCQIVVLSSYDDFEYVKQAMVLGARDYIHKPTMTPDEIIATLNRVAAEIRIRGQWEERKGQQTLPSKKEQLERCLKNWAKGQYPKEVCPELKDMRFVAGAARVLCTDKKEEKREKLLELEARLCDIWEQGLTEDGKEAGAFCHHGDRWIFVRETPFKIEEIEAMCAEVKQLSAGKLLWEDTPYRSPFANMPEIITLLNQRVDNAYVREEELSALGHHVRQAVMMIQENFAQNLSLEAVAADIFVSPAYLSRIFQKEMHCTFGEYLTVRRMEEAKRLLRDTDLTVLQIGEAVGYNNDKYFMNLFKKRVGMTPGRYRQVNKKNPEVQNFTPD